MLTDQDDLLALLDADPIHADDRARIQAAIIADGKAHGAMAYELTPAGWAA